MHLSLSPLFLSSSLAVFIIITIIFKLTLPGERGAETSARRCRAVPEGSGRPPGAPAGVGRCVAGGLAPSGLQRSTGGSRPRRPGRPRSAAPVRGGVCASLCVRPGGQAAAPGSRGGAG